MKVNAILKGIKSENITETNRLIRACDMFVRRKVDLRLNQRRGNAVKEPWRKRGIQQLRIRIQYKSYGNISTSQSERNVEKLKKREIQSNRTQIQSQEKRIKCSSRRAKTKYAG